MKTTKRTNQWVEILKMMTKEKNRTNFTLNDIYTWVQMNKYKAHFPKPGRDTADSPIYLKNYVATCLNNHTKTKNPQIQRTKNQQGNYLYSIIQPNNQ